MVSIIGIGSATDLGTGKENVCVDLYQFCPSCSGVNFTSMKYPNQTILYYNLDMDKKGYDFTYNFCETSQTGDYFYTTCGDPNGVEECKTFSFGITPTGEPKNNTQLFSRIFLIILSIVLVILIQRNSKNVNYDKWYDKLTRKYQDKNYVKWGLGALGYNFMKNSWIFSYLTGLFGLLILTDLTYFFNISSALEIMKIILGIYSWSAIAVSLIFFSQVQEWIVEWIKDIKDMNWGVGK